MTRARRCAPAAAGATVAMIASWVGLTAARAASPEPAPPNATAVVVLVGATAQTADLADLLTELLGRKGVAVRLVQERTFRAADLLAPGDERERSVSVFIEVPSDRVARLSFRGPRAARFLLRELGLRNGLDDVGREAVAQVVESSVAVLLSFSSEGMSRDEANATLARAPSPPPAPGTVVDLGPRPALPARPPAALPAAAIATDVTPAIRQAPARAVWRGWLAPRYSAAYAGPELGPAHGPGAEAALERSGVRLLMRARLVAERRFVQVITSPQLNADVHDDSLRLLFELGWAPRASQAVSLGLGFGADLTAIEPGAALVPDVTPAGATTHVVPVTRAELRYEIGGAAWRVAALLFADASLFDTHYDIVRAGTTERLATPWWVRPGAAVAVGWRF
jgi:ribosomal protein L11